jgi:hypothetical protein
MNDDGRLEDSLLTHQAEGLLSVLHDDLTYSRIPLTRKDRLSRWLVWNQQETIDVNPVSVILLLALMSVTVNTSVSDVSEIRCNGLTMCIFVTNMMYTHN